MGYLPDLFLDILRTLGDAGPNQDWIASNRGAVEDALRVTGNGPAEVGASLDAVLQNFDDRCNSSYSQPTRAYRLQPEQLDCERLQRACHLFARYGTEIGAALLLAALPEAYAASFGSAVLYQISDLAAVNALAGGSETFLTRRIAGTAQFLLDVMVAPRINLPVGSGQTDLLTPCQQIAFGLWNPVQLRGGGGSNPREKWGRAYKQTLLLRMRHGYMRHVADQQATSIRATLISDGPPLTFINQEDLMGTLLTFTVTVFEVLERLGISWTADDQDAYLYAWDVIGHYLGIGDAVVLEQVRSRVGDQMSGEDRVALDRLIRRDTLRPASVDEARQLLARIRARNWATGGNPTGTFDFKQVIKDRQPGRLLFKALVDDIRAAMPPNRQLWPLRVIREVVPNPVRERLAIGGREERDDLLLNLPMRPAIVGRFTKIAQYNPLSGLLLRRMASDVADRYFTRLILSGPLPATGRTFRIPGLDLRSS